MKLVLFSDLHLDAPFAWLGGDQQLARRRRQALRTTLKNVTRLAAEERADALLCGGDLYEQERFTPDTAEFLRRAFQELEPMAVLIAPGNHDWYGPQSLYHRVAWSPNVHVFTADRLQPFTLAEGFTVWGAAHRAPANTDGFLDRFGVDRGGVNVALFHGSERGWLGEQEQGKAPHAPFGADQIPRSGLHHALLGHFHRPSDAALHTYPGNPDPLTFGEDGDRGAVIATFAADGSLTRERRRVGVSEVHDLALDVSGCQSQQDLRDRLAEALATLHGAVRVTLSGELSAQANVRLQDLASVAPHLEALVVRGGSIHTGYDLDSIAREPTVRGQFVRDVRAAGLAAEEMRRVPVTGLRALDGRDELEVL